MEQWLSTIYIIFNVPYFFKYVRISELTYSSSIDRREVTSKILSTRIYINLQ